MATLATKGSIQNLRGLSINAESSGSNKVDLSVVEGKILKILASSTLGLRATATIENLDSVKAGSVIFRVPELVKTKSYDAETNTNDKPNIGTVRVDLNTLRTQKYEVETFDMNAIQNWDALHSAIAYGAAKSIQAELDLVLLKHLHKSASSEIFANALSDEADWMRKTRLKLGKINNSLSTTITKTMLGNNERETWTVVSPDMYLNLLEGASAVGGDKAIEMKLTGDIPGAIILGNAITKHIFLGQDVDSTVFSDIAKDADSNFSNVVSITWNKEAIAFPVHIQEVLEMRNPANGNPVYMTKFRYGIETIRPNLVKSLTLAKSPATSG